MLKKNDFLQLQITSMSAEGFGVARYSDAEAENFVIFVKGAVTGETVLAKIIKVLSSYAIAITDRILNRSPLRTEPVCAVYGRCGGCAFGHVGYEEELRIKHAEISNLIGRSCGTNACEISPVIPSPMEYNYRNKVQMPAAPAGRFGMFAKHSHEIIPSDCCGLNDKAFIAVQKAVESYIRASGASVYSERSGTGLIRHLYLRRAHATGEIMLALVVNGTNIPQPELLISAVKSIPGMASIYLNINRNRTNVILGREFVLLWGREEIYDILCGLKFGIHPNSFYQVNSCQTEQLLKWIKQNAGIKKTDTILDLYCGIGTIGLTLADICAHVIGIETIPQAVANARKNCGLNDIRNAEFFTGNAENAAEILQNTSGRPDIIIVDPPRKGLGTKTIDFILGMLPCKLIYISCNPATLARDLKAILTGGYKIDRIQPFDMFPKTSHVETVILMSKH